MVKDAISRETGEALHRRLVSGDVTAADDVAVTFLPIVTDCLNQHFPQLVYDPDMVDSAVEDAILNYIRRPEQFDPNRMSLERYLRMSARGDLLNSLRQHRMDVSTLQGDMVVELDTPNAEYEVEAQDVLSVEEQAMLLASPVWHRLDDLFPDPLDREMVMMLMEGVRETSEFAALLSVSHFPEAEQAAIVKRNKDRLKKVLQRHLTRSELTNNE